MLDKKKTAGLLRRFFHVSTRKGRCPVSGGGAAICDGVSCGARSTIPTRGDGVSSPDPCGDGVWRRRS
jgi:hypothetical protein